MKTCGRGLPERRGQQQRHGSKTQGSWKFRQFPTCTLPGLQSMPHPAPHVSGTIV